MPKKALNMDLSAILSRALKAYISNGNLSTDILEFEVPLSIEHLSFVFVEPHSFDSGDIAYGEVFIRK